jgi:hypothetical protein
LTTRLEPTDREVIDRAARSAGFTPSGYARLVLLAVSRALVAPDLEALAAETLPPTKRIR